MTRAHVRLLGPCFKTGRVEGRPIRHGSEAAPRVPTLPRRRSGCTAGQSIHGRDRRGRSEAAGLRQGSSVPGGESTRNGRAIEPPHEGGGHLPIPAYDRRGTGRGARPGESALAGGSRAAVRSLRIRAPPPAPNASAS